MLKIKEEIERQIKRQTKEVDESKNGSQTLLYHLGQLDAYTWMKVFIEPLEKEVENDKSKTG